MKQIEQIAEATNFKAINVGKMSNLNEYVLELGPEVKIPGKVFGGAALGATGSEFSLQLFQPGTESGFLHTHKKHEELYFFLGGKGEFQVDGLVFPVEDGKPKIRIFQIMKQDAHTLYFVTSPRKEVYRQLQKNPNIEILAMKDNVSVRIAGQAVFDVDDKTAQEIYAATPVLPRV